MRVLVVMAGVEGDGLEGMAEEVEEVMEEVVAAVEVEAEVMGVEEVGAVRVFFSISFRRPCPGWNGVYIN